MLIESRIEEKYQNYLETAIKILEKKGFESIKAELPDLTPPAALVRQSDDRSYTPDITATRYGAKSYFEIAQKTSDTGHLVAKWKLLAKLAKLKNGEFHIFVPRGAMSFTRDIVAKYNITAEVTKLEGK